MLHCNIIGKAKGKPVIGRSTRESPNHFLEDIHGTDR